MRPLSVTIVGWYLIVTSLLGAYSSATMHLNPVVAALASRSPMPLEVQEVFGVINGFVLAFCGIAILQARSWAKLLFVGWSLLAFVFSVPTLGLVLALALFGLTVGVIMFFLTRPRAKHWFSSPAY